MEIRKSNVETNIEWIIENHKANCKLNWELQIESRINVVSKIDNGNRKSKNGKQIK